MRRNHFILVLSTVFAVLPGLSGFGRAAAQSFRADELADFASKESHVIRKIPKGFHIADTSVYFWAYGYQWVRDTTKHQWKRWAKTGAFGLLLQSDDRQSEVLYSCNGGTKYRVWIESDLLNISQGQDSIRFEEHVRVVSGREVKRRFHADSIFVLELPIEPMEQDGAVYTRCIRMYLTKGERHINFVWFFTDEGYERREEYIRALDGAVYYKRGKWHKSK